MGSTILVPDSLRGVHHCVGVLDSEPSELFLCHLVLLHLKQVFAFRFCMLAVLTYLIFCQQSTERLQVARRQVELPWRWQCTLICSLF